jgi:hypothetical protein
MVWCPYTDQELELNETTPEHIIPMSLGGCNQLVLPVHLATNAILGSEIDGKITQDFVVRFLRREFDARGHSGKKPEVIFKNATFEGRPAQVQFLGGDKLPRIWDARSASYVDEETIAGKQLTIAFEHDRSLIVRFAAKVALSAGYFALGDYWRQYVDHSQARLVMNARTPDQRKELIPKVKILFHDIYNVLSDAQRWFEDVLKLCCASINGPVVMIIPGTENIGVVVGVLRQYLGMINIPADTSNFPSDPAYDLGHCLIVSDRKLTRCSWRVLLWYILKEASQDPLVTGIDPEQFRRQSEQLKELGVVLPEDEKSVTPGKRNPP